MKLRLGISACLLGQAVRWNAGHKRDENVLSMLGPHVEWVPVCPEEAIGLGTPRDPIRLEQRNGQTVLVQPASGLEMRGDMEKMANDWVDSVGHLDGMIFKRGSPSCAIGGINVQENGKQVGQQGGIFAEIVMARTHFPITDEGRLRAPSLRDAFLEQIWGRNRIRRLLDGDPGAGALQEFHAREKYTLLSHDQTRATALGRLVAEGGSAKDYAVLFQEALATPMTAGNHINVMQHIAGFVKDHLSKEEKVKLSLVMTQYADGEVPLVVPLTLLRFLVETREAPDWVAKQTYLDAGPASWRMGTAFE